MTNSEDRYSRQASLVPTEKLATCPITVVGVGAIGRQVALALAAMGAPRLQLVDPDVVEEVNLPVQGYLEADLGQAKVDATATLIRQINSQVQLELHRERFRRSLKVGAVLFCCVDSIATRKLIWEAVKDRVSLFVDGRMSAEVIRVLAAADEASREHYPTTLFAQEDAFVGACTAKSTIYTANIAAGLMVGQFAKWLRCMPVDADVTLNLLSAELAVNSSMSASPSDPVGILERLWSALYVDDQGIVDPEREWNPATLDRIAELVHQVKPRPVTKTPA